jgi:hypothetical protein
MPNVRPINESNTTLNDELERNQPDLAYEGAVPADQDEMDYVNYNVRGVRLG